MSATAPDVEQVYQIAIKASPEAIWNAITQPEFTAQYFYGARITVEPRRLRSIGPDDAVWMDGEVLDFDPPRRLSHTWQSGYNPELADEPASRVTWEIEPGDEGVCVLTVTHDRLQQSPKTATSVAGLGWTMVLSGLKTLVETGRPLATGVA